MGRRSWKGRRSRRSWKGLEGPASGASVFRGVWRLYRAAVEGAVARVAFEIADLVYGGMGMHRYTSGLLSALLQENDISYEFLLFAATPFCNRNNINKNLASVKLLPFPPYIFEALRHLWPLVNLEHFTGKTDLVHTQGSSLIVPPKKAGMIVTMHGISPIRTPQYYTRGFMRDYYKQITHIVKCADFIVALTKDNKQAMVELLNIPPECIEVIPSGVDSSFFALLPENIAATLSSYNLKMGGYILYVGRLDPHKNIKGILIAYARLPSYIRDSYELVFAGPGDPLKLGWVALAEKLHISGSIKWLGHLLPEEIPAIMNGARLFIFPSFCEGFALPPLEAMACGVPVVVSDFSSLVESVGEGGAYVRADNPEEWGFVIEQVLTDKEYRMKLISMGKTHANKFSWQNSAKQFLQLYGRLLSGGLEEARRAWPRKTRR